MTVAFPKPDGSVYGVLSTDFNLNYDPGDISSLYKDQPSTTYFLYTQDLVPLLFLGKDISDPDVTIDQLMFSNPQSAEAGSFRTQILPQIAKINEPTIFEFE